MPKRKKKWPKGWLIDPEQVQYWIYQATVQIQQKDYDSAVRTCKQALRYIPARDKLRAEALTWLATGYTLQKQSGDAYTALKQAVDIDPDGSFLAYNFAISCRYTFRFGASLRAMERAVALEGVGKMASKFREELANAQMMVQNEIEIRQPGFTLDDLIAQEERIQQAITFMKQEDWAQVEELLRGAIAMDDCLPQPWNNLGIALMKRGRLDESEAAFRRALEIEPGYQNAKDNLKVLAYHRRHPDHQIEHEITTPFDKIKTGLIIEPPDEVG